MTARESELSERSSKAQIAGLLYRAIRELAYVQDVENCHSGLCATAEGKAVVQQGMRVLEVKDLRAESYTLPASPAEDVAAIRDTMSPAEPAPCCAHADEDHVLTAYRRYCTKCGCEVKKCLCAPQGMNTECPMHGGNRLTAKDEPAPGLIERMLNAYYAKPISGNTREQMTAAYQIARQHDMKDRDKQWEKIAGDVFNHARYNAPQWGRDDFLYECRKRFQPVQPVETLQEKVAKKLISHDFVGEGIDATEKCAAEIIALVRGEMEGK